VTPHVRSSRAAPEPSDAPTPSRPLELVDPDAWRRRRRARVVGALVALVCVVSPFVVVVMNVEMAQRQMQLQRMHTELDAEQTQFETLRTQVLQESSPQGIVQQAEHAGLQPAGDVTAVTVPKSDAAPAADSGDAALSAADNATKNEVALAP
jgi:hypothetical protein